MKTKSLPVLPPAETERLTHYCHDQAEAEGVTPAAIANRVANDPQLLAAATTYLRPEPAKPTEPKPDPQPASTKDKGPKTKDHQ